MGVGGVVLIGGRVVLIRRGKEPLRGRWVIPGGTVELGDQREGAEVEYHYVIIDYACDYVSGELQAGSDADEVALVAPDELGGYDLPPQALELVLDVFRRGV